MIKKYGYKVWLQSMVTKYGYKVFAIYFSACNFPRFIK